MRPENLVLFERARRVRFRATLCRELIALCRNEKTIADLESMARDFEAHASELERKARQAATNVRRIERPGEFEASPAESHAVPEPLRPGDDDSSDGSR